MVYPSSFWEHFKLLLFPFHQLYWRIEHAGNSLDNEGLLFPLYNLNFINLGPYFSLLFRGVKKGKGTKKPYDEMMYTTLYFHCIISVILSLMDANLSLLLEMFLNVLAIIIPFIIREIERCKCLRLPNIVNAIANAMSVYGDALNLKFHWSFVIVNIVSSIPNPFMVLKLLLIGITWPLELIGLAGMIPYVGWTIEWAPYFIYAYMIHNMRTSQIEEEEYCSQPLNTQKIAKAYDKIEKVLFFKFGMELVESVISSIISLHLGF